MCFCVDGWCTEHDWQSSRSCDSYSIVLPVGNFSNLVWAAPDRSSYIAHIQAILGKSIIFEAYYFDWSPAPSGKFYS